MVEPRFFSAGMEAGLHNMKQRLDSNLLSRSGESVGVEVGAFGFVVVQTSSILSGVFLAIELTT